jgi:hypothetical protein
LGNSSIGEAVLQKKPQQGLAGICQFLNDDIFLLFPMLFFYGAWNLILFCFSDVLIAAGFDEEKNPGALHVLFQGIVLQLTNMTSLLKIF